ncbi:acyltransferase family protein [Bacillus sp. FJAT-45037]|uniref:acyltransferase family protein n=1 Tax=Bacillus sp. FJAT-45037 TaxID=2011007 RepID=UPI000C236DA7|nr:acyltransferase family protein [Bacillus sp. FJAT-45037]
MNKQLINEAFWIRAIACLAVATTHAVDTTLANYEYSANQLEEHLLILLRFMAYFGTPAFVFLSELLLAKAYPNDVPKGFFKKRIKFLLIPFVSIGLLFAFLISDSLLEAIRQAFVHIFLGGYYGYFILIIFQFYLLHVLLQKHLKNWSPKLVLSLAFIINVSYLGFFNFTEPVNTSAAAEYIWLRGYWVPFLGWIFYFVLGYYCGRNYEALKVKLFEHKKKILILPVLSIALIVVLVLTDILNVVSSKRVDMLLYTMSMIFAIIVLTMKINRVPVFIKFISKYSFNIYLLHKFILYVMVPIDFLNPLVYFVFVYIVAVGGSIVLAQLLSKVKYSEYIIGKQLVMTEDVEVKRGKGRSF